MKVGMGLAFITAILALVLMAYVWKGSPESAARVGLDMLVATMFFALAGCFSSHSPVKTNTIIVLSGLTVAFVIIAAIFAAMSPGTAVFFVIMGIICGVIGNMGCTRNYVEQNRVA